MSDQYHNYIENQILQLESRGIKLTPENKRMFREAGKYARIHGHNQGTLQGTLKSIYFGEDVQGTGKPDLHSSMTGNVQHPSYFPMHNPEGIGTKPVYEGASGRLLFTPLGMNSNPLSDGARNLFVDSMIGVSSANAMNSALQGANAHRYLNNPQFWQKSALAKVGSDYAKVNTAYHQLTNRMADAIKGGGQSALRTGLSGIARFPIANAFGALAGYASFQDVMSSRKGDKDLVAAMSVLFNEDHTNFLTSVAQAHSARTGKGQEGQEPLPTDFGYIRDNFSADDYIEGFYSYLDSNIVDADKVTRDQILQQKGRGNHNVVAKKFLHSVGLEYSQADPDDQAQRMYRPIGRLRKTETVDGKRVTTYPFDPKARVRTESTWFDGLQTPKRAPSPKASDSPAGYLAQGLGGMRNVMQFKEGNPISSTYIPKAVEFDRTAKALSAFAEEEGVDGYHMESIRKAGGDRYLESPKISAELDEQRRQAESTLLSPAGRIQEDGSVVPPNVSQEKGKWHKWTDGRGGDRFMKGFLKGLGFGDDDE